MPGRDDVTGMHPAFGGRGLQGGLQRAVQAVRVLALQAAGPGRRGYLGLTGLRGAGTMQLAAEYARARLAEGWRLVAWVHAEDTGTLLAGLAAVADAAGLSGAVIARQHLGYQTYLDRLRALPAEEYLEQPYSPGVAQAVLLSLDTLRAGDQAGVCTALMGIMAVLSAAGVRRDLLHADGQAGVAGSPGRAGSRGAAAGGVPAGRLAAGSPRAGACGVARSPGRQGYPRAGCSAG